MSNVYSYLRFSAAKQASGSSTDRQLQYARQWAEAHGLTLDESMSMRDEGLSAYHQKHIKSGALGVFLEAITAGRIPSGSVLIVEGLDRLSRAEPILAQNQLAQIILAGVSVVTASDGKVYSRGELKRDPMGLIYSILIMIRANEESETKSKRVAAAVRRRCEAWVAGTFRGRVLGGKDPSWVRWADGKAELVPDVAHAVRTAILLYLDGNGPAKIVKRMAEMGLTIPGSTRGSNVDALITKQPHLFAGERRIRADGVDFTLVGYYPALLSDVEYARLRIAIAERAQAPRRNGAKALYPAIITGMRITTCGRCGDWVVGQNQISKGDGTRAGRLVYRRVRCPSCELESSVAGINHFGSCSAEAVERAIIDYCADQMNLEALLDRPGGRHSQTQAELLQLRAKIAEAEQKVAKIIDAALALDGDLPVALLKKSKALEAEIEALKDKEGLLAAQEVLPDSRGGAATAKMWADLREGIIALDHDARMRCRQLVLDTFSGIQIYFRGALAHVKTDTVDIVLTARNGATRSMRIDRVSGRIVRALNFNRDVGERGGDTLDGTVAEKHLLPR